MALMLVVAVALTGCGEGRALDRLAAGEHGKVVAVRSGDVVVLDSGLVVRLAGLETPRADDPGADEARDALSKLVRGRTVQLYYGGLRRDPFGRALAQVRIAGGGWAQGEMLREGEAQVRTFSDNRAMAREMLDDEARARIAKQGLWRAGGAYQVRLPQEVDRSTTGFQVIEGRVARASDSGRGVYLDFERGGAFAAQVPKAAVLDLTQAGLAPGKLAGHLIRVRGVIGWDDTMKIDHPEQVEVVDGK